MKDSYSVDIFVDSEALLKEIRLRDAGVWILDGDASGHSSILHASSLLSLDLDIRSDRVSVYVQHIIGRHMRF